jgi:4-aminobutyrate aminotransferase-like enzyme
VLKIKPPMVINRDDVDLLLNVLGDFLPTVRI